jgi:hypothetical protein
MKFHLEDGARLVVTGEVRNGLSHSTNYERAGQLNGKDVWSIQTLYAVKIMFPKYIKEMADLRYTYELEAPRASVNEEVGLQFSTTNEEGFTILFLTSEPFSWDTANAFKRHVEKSWREVKLPFFMAWKEKRQSTSMKGVYTKASKQVVDTVKNSSGTHEKTD